MTPGRKKTLAIFSIFYILASLSLFVFIKNISQNFSLDKVNYLTDTVSSLRDKTDNPCLYAVRGDPGGVGKNYIKISFYCSDQTKAKSTISLEAVSGSTLADALREYARIIGFDYNIITNENWLCFQEKRKIESLSDPIVKAGELDCYQSQSLIPTPAPIL